MKKLILTAVLLFSFLGKSFADGHVIKAEKSMLYFAGLYPSYILYLQGGIPEDTKDNWVDKDYWAVLEIDESSKNHGGEAVIFKLKKFESFIYFTRFKKVFSDTPNLFSFLPVEI